MENSFCIAEKSLEFERFGCSPKWDFPLERVICDTNEHRQRDWGLDATLSDQSDILQLDDRNERVLEAKDYNAR